MPTSAEPNGSPSDKPNKSRLEREIEEILAKTERENPLPPPTPIRPDVKTPMEKFTSGVSIPDLSGAGESVRKWLDSASIFVALMLAILAWMVGTFSPFLATIVAIAAVVALFWPLVAMHRSPRPEAKTWRGRTYEGRQEPPETVIRIREWLRRKRNGN